MRIGLIAPPGLPIPPRAYGGTESVIDRLARGLVGAGHEVLLAAASNSTCPVPRVSGTEEALEDAPVCVDTNTELRHVIRAYAAMSDVDVVHDHTLTGPLCARAPVGTPVVSTAHGPFDAMLAPLYRAFRGVALVAISHHQAATAEGIPLAGVIHHGLDVGSVPVGRGSGGYASFLGRMSPEKGPREAALVARAAGVPLRMAAKLREPAELAYFEAEVKPLLCSDVEFLGELGHDEKLELVGDSFALLNPMQWAEPFGLVMIEALATGTPVVATPVGSAPELVEDGVTGHLRRGIPGLAAALLDAPELDRSTCRAVAARWFSSERMVADHVRLYEELLSRPAHSYYPLDEAAAPVVRPPALGHRLATGL
ncbi:glycosyltransferase family 4 protein [Nocardioides sp. BP30]|uniref:glycosyltransferase family 4 protein n=1 Tax=Nocardioides sp. BP30 TaxID=3036374 RepID=UPI002468A30C|nr:glycosyltransferase family 4 protein [Nocardioides sp. BP30]WGL50354.1 glycosyltransferase family 4 protein [Nocardioides sp. BP30]